MVAAVADVEEGDELEGVDQFGRLRAAREDFERRAAEFDIGDCAFIFIELPLLVAAHRVVAADPELLARQEILARELPPEHRKEPEIVGELLAVGERAPAVDPVIFRAGADRLVIGVRLVGEPFARRPVAFQAVVEPVAASFKVAGVFRCELEKINTT